MSVKLNNNPTCVLTDADIYSESQKAKMAKNLMSGLPASTGEGDKVLVLDENGDPQLKDYSAGGGGSSSYTAGDGISISNDVISTKIDGSTITLNASGELQASGGGASYSAGDGILIMGNQISANIDFSTITLNSAGELQVAGGGSGSETPCIVDWANLTAEEIFSFVRTAVSANQPVFAKYQPVGYFTPYYYPLSSWSDHNGYTSVKFIGFQTINEYSAFGTNLIGGKDGPSANPEKTETTFHCNFVPAPPERAADGTTLQIQDGSMTWVTP